MGTTGAESTQRSCSPLKTRLQVLLSTLLCTLLLGGTLLADGAERHPCGAIESILLDGDLDLPDQGWTDPEPQVLPSRRRPSSDLNPDRQRYSHGPWTLPTRFASRPPVRAPPVRS